MKIGMQNPIPRPNPDPNPGCTAYTKQHIGLYRKSGFVTGETPCYMLYYGSKSAR